MNEDGINQIVAKNCMENSIKTKHIDDLVWQDNDGKMIQKLLNHLATIILPKYFFASYAFWGLVVACPTLCHNVHKLKIKFLRAQFFTNRKKSKSLSVGLNLSVGRPKGFGFCLV